MIDEAVDLNGIKIYGTPWSLEFYNWAFMLPKEELLEEIFNGIPEDADIVLAHTPPVISGSRIDTVYTSPEMHLGSKALTKVVEKRPNLKYLFCGHIHTGDHDESLIGNTKCHNVSLLDEMYKVTYSPMIVEL